MSAYITGYTNSTDFSTADPIQARYGGGESDAFVAKFDSTGHTVFSTFLGGSKFDEGVGIAVDATGNAYVTGDTSSTDFPLQNLLWIHRQM